MIEGSGACTTVDGERVHMEPGDLLLTPGWHWHDHHHEFEGPMIWLDGLDYPLVNMLEAGFFELHEERRQKVVVADDAVLFSFDDAPTSRALGFFREEAVDA